MWRQDGRYIVGEESRAVAHVYRPDDLTLILGGLGLLQRLVDGDSTALPEARALLERMK